MVAPRSQPSLASILRDQRLAEAGLVGVVMLAIALRLVPFLLAPSMNWADEIFQAVEQAHRLVYGIGLVPWEFQLGARSWLLPGFIAGAMELARLFGDQPDYYLPTIAGALATLAAAPVVCSFLWARRLFGIEGAFAAAIAVAVAPELMYFGARSFSEVVAGHLLVIALYVLEPGYRVVSHRRLFIGGALLAVVFVLRIQLAPALLIIALWASWRGERGRVLAMLGGAVAVLSLTAILDIMTVGYPLASLWRYVLYNMYFGVSSSFGTEPWYYYLGVELGVWRGALALLLPATLLGARRLPLLLAAAVTILAVHCVIPHKEYRFIYPALLLVMVLAGMGLAELASWRAYPRRASASRAVARPLCVAVIVAAWGAVSLTVSSGPTLAGLRDSARNNLSAASFVSHGPAPCGIGLYGLGGDDWAAYGGYTYFHRSAPMYWPKDETTLAAAAAGFDTLLYTRPPTPALGFTVAQCFGEVCVARRAGGCQSIPMATIPVPDALVDVAAAKKTSSPISGHAGIATRGPVSEGKQ